MLSGQSHGYQSFVLANSLFGDTETADIIAQVDIHRESCQQLHLLSFVQHTLDVPFGHHLREETAQATSVHLFTSRETAQQEILHK